VRARQVREEGYVDRRGKWHGPWGPKKQARRLMVLSRPSGKPAAVSRRLAARIRERRAEGWSIGRIADRLGRLPVEVRAVLAGATSAPVSLPVGFHWCKPRRCRTCGALVRTKPCLTCALERFAANRREQAAPPADETKTLEPQP